MARRLAVAKRISLEGAAKGWTDECYVLMMPVSYPDMIEAQQRDKSEDDVSSNVEWQNSFLANHFVSGKVMVYGDDGNLQLVDMLVDDLLVTKEIAEMIMAIVLGGDVADPKDSSAAPDSTEKQSSDAKPTETPSSEDPPSDGSTAAS